MTKYIKFGRKATLSPPVDLKGWTHLRDVRVVLNVTVGTLHYFYDMYFLITNSNLQNHCHINMLNAEVQPVLDYLATVTTHAIIHFQEVI